METKVEENRIHRDLVANPRKWPHGKGRVPSKYRCGDMGDLVLRTKRMALLDQWERELIYYLPLMTKDGDYANLGHSHGASAILMASALVNNLLSGTIESIDIFSKPRDHRRALQNLEYFPEAKGRINLRVGSTDHWAKEFKDRKFRGVFVDADHSYEAVKADSLAWMPLVAKGGFICFHDTHQDFSHNAVEETVVQNPDFKEAEHLHVSTIRVFIRQ